jgi:hypothetical protein
MWRMMTAEHPTKGKLIMLAATPEIIPCLDQYRRAPRGKCVPLVGLIGMASPDLDNPNSPPTIMEPCYWTPAVALLEPGYIKTLALTWADEWQKPLVYWQQGVYGGVRGWAWPKSWTQEQRETYQKEGHEADKSPVFMMEVEDLTEPLRSTMPILRELMKGEKLEDFDSPV